MQISAFPFSGPDLSRLQTAPGKDPVSLPALQNRADGAQKSGLASIYTQMGWSEVSLQADQSSLTYRKDGSLALKVDTHLDVSYRSQETDIELTLPAEFFGAGVFSASAFTNGPLQVTMEYRSLTQQMQTKTQISQVTPLRSAGDILHDITKAISQVLQNKGDKSVFLHMDDAAIHALLSDPSIQKVMKEISALLCLVNSMAAQDSARDKYTIRVSGKGSPYQDVQQNTTIRGESNTVRLKLVILPPQPDQASSNSETGEAKGAE